MPIWFLTCEANLWTFVKNNAKHISSLAMHIGIVNMQKFFPYPYQMQFDKYDNHAASHCSYMSQNYNWPFHHNFGFVRCVFGSFFWGNNTAMIVNTNAQFW